MLSREKWRRLLVEEKLRLERSIRHLEEAGLDRSFGESMSEMALYDNHPADIGSETFEREKDFGLREDQMTNLDMVEMALGRLDEGTYGVCERCGRPIAEARLEAVPWTAFCVQCEAALEADEARDWARPAEEDVRPAFSTFTGGSNRLGFDGEDAWQAVARYGTSSSVAKNPPGAFDESSAGHDETAGLVEAVDAIADVSHDPGRLVDANPPAGQPDGTPDGFAPDPGGDSEGRSGRSGGRKKRSGR